MLWFHDSYRLPSVVHSDLPGSLALPVPVSHVPPARVLQRARRRRFYRKGHQQQPACAGGLPCAVSVQYIAVRHTACSCPVENILCAVLLMLRQGTPITGFEGRHTMGDLEAATYRTLHCEAVRLQYYPQNHCTTPTTYSSSNTDKNVCFQ